ncbi:hypothetical protein ACJX0J_015969, partial [Zea mays]
SMLKKHVAICTFKFLHLNKKINKEKMVRGFATSSVKKCLFEYAWTGEDMQREGNEVVAANRALLAGRPNRSTVYTSFKHFRVGFDTGMRV